MYWIVAFVALKLRIFSKYCQIPECARPCSAMQSCVFPFFDITCRTWNLYIKKIHFSNPCIVFHSRQTYSLHSEYSHTCSAHSLRAGQLYLWTRQEGLRNFSEQEFFPTEVVQIFFGLVPYIFHFVARFTQFFFLCFCCARIFLGNYSAPTSRI